ILGGQGREDQEDSQGRDGASEKSSRPVLHVPEALHRSIGAPSMRALLLGAGGLVLLALVYRLGAASIASTLARITWWQFGLVCALHGLNVAADTGGWKYAIARDGVPFHKLLAARCAGDAMNVLTAV